MTSRQVTHDIPVYPVGAKFLAYHYNTAPFAVTNIGNPYSTYLYACLDRYDHRDAAILPRKYNKLTATLTVSIAHWRIKSFATGTISPHKVAAFNDFVRQMFFEKLTQEVALQTRLGMGVKTALERVLDRYGILESELSISTVLTYYYRNLRKLQLEYCHLLAETPVVILPHERDRTERQMESWGRQVA